MSHSAKEKNLTEREVQKKKRQRIEIIREVERLDPRRSSLQIQHWWGRGMMLFTFNIIELF